MPEPVTVQKIGANLIFMQAWNDRYPYKFWTEDGGHTISMRVSTFEAAEQDKKTFPKGVEEAAWELAPKLGLKWRRVFATKDKYELVPIRNLPTEVIREARQAYLKRLNGGLGAFKPFDLRKAMEKAAGGRNILTPDLIDELRGRMSPRGLVRDYHHEFEKMVKEGNARTIEKSPDDWRYDRYLVFSWGK